MPDQEAQRVEDALGRLVQAHAPSSMSAERFRGHQYDAGLAWVGFPEGFGGLGVRPELQELVDVRLRELGAKSPRPASAFLALAGPTIVTHGTDDQKRRLLRPMYTGAELWCQLFSEPGAGSDFAGLATRAVRDGDEWVVNGQKVWNTLAHVADWGMLVARSDPDVPKHRGLTYFAVDMHSVGVEVRPLRQMTGGAEFNEVYFTDLRVPDVYRIGSIGDGWRVALTTLMNERAALGGGEGQSLPTRGSGVIADLVAVWRSLDADKRGPVLRDRVTDLWIGAEVLRLTSIRTAVSRRVGNPGPDGSIGKLGAAKLNKAIYEACIDLLGANGLLDYDYTFNRPDRPSFTGAEHGVRHAFLRTRANSIEGGTSEIMRNIIGEQVLGLPGEPRSDKGVAWSQVPRN